MKRTENLPHVRVTTSEKAHIQEQAADLDMKVSEFIREIASMDWALCDRCGGLILLDCVMGFSATSTEPEEEPIMEGKCFECGKEYWCYEGEYRK